MGTHGYNAITRSCNPQDDNFHGTHVSGTIGAVGNNGLGVVGVNWTSNIMGLKFLNAQGQGTTENAIVAIDFAVQAKIAGQNVRVLNNSWGGGGPSQALLDEINKADANDILFAAAAGNNGTNNDTMPFYPANYNTPNMVAVAATDNKDQKASFSNYGATTVHLGAPGANVLSTRPANTYGYLSGTSMATPHVSGAAALVLAAKPTLTTAQLKSAILTNVDPIPSMNGRTITGGRLNVCKAITSCPDFALSAVPASQTVVQGDGTTYAVTVTPSGGFTGTVTFSASGFPAGAGGSFNPPSVTTSGNSTFTVTTSPSTPAGSYPLTITGTSPSPSLTRTTGVTLVVTSSTCAPTSTPWAACYSVGNTPTSWLKNEIKTYSVTVTNAGTMTWPAGGPTPVHLGVHFANVGGGYGSNTWYTDERFLLASDLAPGASAVLTITVTGPPNTGNLVLEYQMVKEAQFWFSQFSAVNVTVT
jgi:hypothetical protein